MAKVSKCAGKRVSWDSKKARSRTIGYFSHHTPDLTLLHGAPDKSHARIGIIGPSLVTQDHVVSASAIPLAATHAAE